MQKEKNKFLIVLVKAPGLVWFCFLTVLSFLLPVLCVFLDWQIVCL